MGNIDDLTDDDIAALGARLMPYWEAALAGAFRTMTDYVRHHTVGLGVGDVIGNTTSEVTIASSDNPAGAVYATRCSASQLPGQRVLIIYGPNGSAYAVGVIPIDPNTSADPT